MTGRAALQPLRRLINLIALRPGPAHFCQNVWHRKLGLNICQGKTFTSLSHFKVAAPLKKTHLLIAGVVDAPKLVSSLALTGFPS